MAICSVSFCGCDKVNSQNAERAIRKAEIDKKVGEAGSNATDTSTRMLAESENKRKRRVEAIPKLLKAAIQIGESKHVNGYLVHVKSLSKTPALEIIVEVERPKIAEEDSSLTHVEVLNEYTIRNPLPLKVSLARSQPWKWHAGSLESTKNPNVLDIYQTSATLSRIYTGFDADCILSTDDQDKVIFVFISCQSGKNLEFVIDLRGQSIDPKSPDEKLNRKFRPTFTDPKLYLKKKSQNDTSSKGKPDADHNDN